MPLSFDQQVDLWRFAYARSAMNEVLGAADELLRSPPLSRNARLAISQALIVSYARPFTRWQVAPKKCVVPLDGAPEVPAHLKQAHIDCLELRNKIVGHKDATPSPGRTGTPNVVHLVVREKGYDLHTVELGFTPELLGELKELAVFFISFCENKVIPLGAAMAPDLLGVGPGTYDILPSEPPTPWLRRVRPLGPLI